MRSTLDLPAELREGARRLLAYNSKTDTVVFSLRELVRRKRIEEIESLAGKIRLDVDVDRSRRRAKARNAGQRSR